MRLEIPEAVMATGSYGWLWAALKLPMREDGTFPDRSCRFRLLTMAEHYLPRNGWVLAHEVTAALDAARTEYAEICATSAQTWAQQAEASEASAQKADAKAKRVESEWSSRARFGVGWLHRHAGHGGMRDRDLARHDEALGQADASREAARKCRHLARRLDQAARAAIAC